MNIIYKIIFFHITFSFFPYLLVAQTMYYESNSLGQPLKLINSFKEEGYVLKISLDHSQNETRELFWDGTWQDCWLVKLNRLGSIRWLARYDQNNYLIYSEEYDENGHLISETHYVNGWQTHKSLFLYSADGILQETFVYEEGVLAVEQEYFYNETGKIFQIMSNEAINYFHHNTSINSQQNNMIEENYKEGLLVKSQKKQSGNVVLGRFYQYKDNLLESATFKDYIENIETIETYDKNGLLLNRIEKRQDVFERQTSYEYDDFVLIRESVGFANGNSEVSIFTYNENGQLKEILISSNGDLRKKIQYIDDHEYHELYYLNGQLLLYEIYVDGLLKKDKL